MRLLFLMVFAASPVYAAYSFFTIDQCVAPSEEYVRGMGGPRLAQLREAYPDAMRDPAVAAKAHILANAGRSPGTEVKDGKPFEDWVTRNFDDFQTQILLRADAAFPKVMERHMGDALPMEQLAYLVSRGRVTSVEELSRNESNLPRWLRQTYMAEKAVERAENFSQVETGLHRLDKFPGLMKNPQYRQMARRLAESGQEIPDFATAADCATWLNGRYASYRDNIVNKIARNHPISVGDIGPWTVAEYPRDQLRYLIDQGIVRDAADIAGLGNELETRRWITASFVQAQFEERIQDKDKFSRAIADEYMRSHDGAPNDFNRDPKVFFERTVQTIALMAARKEMDLLAKSSADLQDLWQNNTVEGDARTVWLHRYSGMRKENPFHATTIADGEYIDWLQRTFELDQGSGRLGPILTLFEGPYVEGNTPSGQSKTTYSDGFNTLVRRWHAPR